MSVAVSNGNEGREVANPFRTENAAAPSVPGALVAVEQQRAIAEVQARMLIARANPRDPVRCMDLILQDCTRPSLAEGALYQYSRGGSPVSGPSIRLAECLARRWGNIACGVKEVARHNGMSEAVAYSWDLETGFYDERQFQVRHWRDTKQGGYRLTDERDIYELIANMGARRKRAALLAVIPGDVVEAAVAQCEETLRTKADTSPEAIKKMVAAFGEIGVSAEQIAARCQCRIEAIRPAQVVQLRKIYASIKDEMSTPEDWFAPAQNGETVHDAKGTAGLKEKLRKTAPKQSDAAKELAEKLARSEAPHDPDTGEIATADAPRERDPGEEG